MHYGRLQRNGDPIIGGILPMPERFWAKVEKADSCWNWTGAKGGGPGYGQISIMTKKIWAHRWSYENSYGPIPDGMHVDHICFNPACVNPAHLRLATPKQNQENHLGAQRNSISGVRGVHPHKPSGRWLASLMHNRQTIRIGLFDTIEEAEKAVIARRNELFTHNYVDRIKK